jgi:hypothetical protein
MIMSPVAVAEQSLSAFWAKARQLFRQQFENSKGNLDLRTILYQLIGALLYTTSFALFIFADFHLMCLTLAGMGIESSHFVPPMGAGSLTVLALIAGVLFFGTMFLDLLGMTEVAPWKERLPKGWKMVVYAICVIALIISIIIASLSGYWRGESLSNDEVAASDLNSDMSYLSDSTMQNYATPMLATEAIKQENDVDWILISINVAIPTILLLGGCLSGWGIVELVKFLILLAIFLAICPTGLILIILSYTTRIIDRVYDVALAIIGLLAAIGRWFLGIFRYRPPYGQTDYSQNDDIYNGYPPEGENNSADSKVSEDEEAPTEDCENQDTKNHQGFNPYE